MKQRGKNQSNHKEGEELNKVNLQNWQNGESNYVMQFKDGTFLQRGLFHGLVRDGNIFRFGKTKDLKEAVSFSAEWEADRIARDLGVDEPYEIKEIEIIFRLK